MWWKMPPRRVIQQLRESFPGDSTPRYLIFDNDTIFSDDVSKARAITQKRDTAAAITSRIMRRRALQKVHGDASATRHETWLNFEQ
jgi:hypothetical protein